LLAEFDASKLKKKPAVGSTPAAASTEDKLRALQAKINKARQDAKKLTVEENKNTDSFTGQIRIRAEPENEEKKEPKTAEEKEELDRRGRLNVTAGDLEKKYKSQKRKGGPEDLFGDVAIYESFKKRSKKAKFSAAEYDAQLDQIGEHGDEINTMQYLQQHQPEDERVDAMVKELEEQANRRSQFSRRRTHNEDADVTFINERNRNFNKKIARAFDKYTVEIKENLERGTAL
jgi:hypothetical protein